MVSKEPMVWRLGKFLQRHGVAILAAVGFYCLFLIPSTFVQVEVLRDPSGLSNRQTFFWFGNTTTDTDEIGVCSYNEIVWANEPQKWLFYGWLYAARISAFVMFNGLLRYIAHYRMPTAIFALILISVIAVSMVVAFTWFNELLTTPSYRCNDVPRLQILYFLPTIIHVALPFWWGWYVEKLLKSEPQSSVDIVKGT